MHKSDFITVVDGKFKDHYSLGKVIGTGALGEVRKCKHKTTDILRAVKIIKKEKMNETEQKFFEGELATLKKLDHPNIIKIYEVFEEHRNWFLVTELCKGGELFDQITAKGSYSENDAAHIIEQVLKATAYCHAQGIVHRDLKPENLLFDADEDNSLKLIDFGTSVAYDKKRDKLKDVMGTSYYIAPEVLAEDYDERCDVWSVGVLMYILLSGKAPFDGATDDEIIANIIKGEYSMSDPIWNEISEDATRLIKKMLTRDYKKRIYAKDALKDKWFKNAPKQHIDPALMKQALSSIKTFNYSSKLQQVTMQMMTQSMVSKEEEQRLRKVFLQLDNDGNGYLEYDELLKGLTAIYGADYAKEETNRIFALVDVDHSGKIDFSEYLQASVDKDELLKEEKLKAAFDLYDKDKSGSISIEEFKTILGVGKKISPEVWDQMVTEIDENGDGEVDFGEFKTMMTKIT